MRRAVLLALLFVSLLACGLVPVLRNRATDMAAYRRAASVLAARGDPWRGGEPRYLYPPLLAAAFVPLRAVPERPVAIGWAALSAAAMTLAAARLGPRAPLLALLFAPLYATQWNAQVNGLLLLALVLARERLAREDEEGGGALWGLSVGLKPLALPAALGFLLTSRLRTLVAGAAAAGVSLLAVVPFLGWRGVPLAARHVARILRATWPDTWPANVSLSGTLDRFLPLRPGSHRHEIVAACVFALAALAVLAVRRKAGGAATLDVFLVATLLAAGAAWLHHAAVLLPLAVGAGAAGWAAAALFAAAAAWRLAASLWPAHGAAAAAACGTLGLALLAFGALRRLFAGER